MSSTTSPSTPDAANTARTLDVRLTFESVRWREAGTARPSESTRSEDSRMIRYPITVLMDSYRPTDGPRMNDTGNSAPTPSRTPARFPSMDAFTAVQPRPALASL